MSPSASKLISFTAAGILLLVIVFSITTFVAINPGDSIILTRGEFTTTQYGRIFSASVQNKTANQFSKVQAQIYFLNVKGKTVGTFTATKEVLTGGERWDFQVPVDTLDIVDFTVKITPQ